MKSMMMAMTMALVGTVLAQGPEVARRPAGGRGPAASDPLVRLVSNHKMAEKIGINPEQISGIKAIAKEMRQAERGLRDKMRSAMKKQTDLLQAEKVDEAAAMAAIDELFEVRKEMAKNQTRQLIRVKALLTPEQIAAAKKVMLSRQDRKVRRGKGPSAPDDEPRNEAGKGSSEDEAKQ